MMKKVLAILLVIMLLISLMMCSAVALEKGDKGESVKKLQKRLVKLKYYKITKLTGVYSDAEVEAVKAFQSNNGLEPTGIADDETLELLYDKKRAKRATGSSGAGGKKAINNSRVDAIPVGSETKRLSFEVVDKGLEYWKNSIGSVEAFAYIAIKNTDDSFIYLDGCKFEYEDNDGHLIDTESMVSSCPDVIAPDEIGYFYVSGVNGGYLDDSVDISKGVNLKAQFSLEEAREAVFPYEISDDRLEYEETFGKEYPIVRGRVTNDTDEDDDMFYINVVYKDINGKVISITGTNVMDLYAGSTVGFEIGSYLSTTPGLTKENIGSYEIIALPHYYQF